MSELVNPNSGREPPAKFDWRWSLFKIILATLGGLSAVTLAFIAAIAKSDRQGNEYIVECTALVLGFIAFTSVYAIRTMRGKDED